SLSGALDVRAAGANARVGDAASAGGDASTQSAAMAGGEASASPDRQEAGRTPGGVPAAAPTGPDRPGAGSTTGGVTVPVPGSPDQPGSSLSKPPEHRGAPPGRAVRLEAQHREKTIPLRTDHVYELLGTMPPRSIP